MPSGNETDELKPAPPLSRAEEVEAYLESWLARRPLPPNLAEAVRYGLLGGGKRVRATLAIESCCAVGGALEAALPAAGAIELVHAFSLAHDDLPCMDDADLRRGRPTLHKHAGETLAVLAGDALLGLAFELLATSSAPAQVGRQVSELSVATNDMIAGQVWDTLPAFDDDVPPLERLRTIHRNKTGALIRCACRMGAVAGGADEAALQAVTRYAEAIGLMFQVVDDLLDVTQDTAHLGKDAQRDEERGKLTYPALLGIEASRAEVRRLRTEAGDALAELGGQADPLRRFCAWLAIRTN